MYIWEEIFDYTKDNSQLANELEIELEICYLQWFINNWYAVSGQLVRRLDYFIIENNSVRNFDLLRFNFTDLFPNHIGPQKVRPYYKNKLTSHEIRQRILLDMVDHIYHKPLIRTLTKGKTTAVFWYSKCELSIKEFSGKSEPKLILNEKIKPHENHYTVKSKLLSLLVSKIDELLNKGFAETG